MSLLTIMIALGIVGIILYLINRFIPMDPKIKTILNWVVIVIVLIWLLKAVGAIAYLSTIKI